MCARVPGDVIAAKKGKERVVDEKSVTQCNSARDSFANRIENGGSFAKEPAARRSSLPCAVVRLGHAPAWAVPCARARCAWLGRAARIGPLDRNQFSISSKFVNIYSIIV